MTNNLSARFAPLGALAPAFSIAFAIALAGCSPTAETPPAEPPLKGATIGGDFELVSETGETVKFSDFEGQYRTVYFGYAFCPDVCPTDNQRAMAGLRAFEKAEPELGAKIQPLFISIDPERDTPEVVGEFTDAFHPRLIGLTGSPEQIAATAKAFAVHYARGADSPGGGYLMDHSNITYLFGPDGLPIATLPTDLDAEAVAQELAKWVR